jgi:hypothetical protein
MSWELHEGDCIPWLETLDPAGMVMITDPPYGIKVERHRVSSVEKLASRLQGDHSQEVGQEALDWAAEHGLPTVAFAAPMKPWVGQWRQWLVWDKGPAVGGNGDYPKTWKHCWELIQVARNRDLIGPRDSSVLQFWISPFPGGFPHPTMKPVELMAYLISKLVPEGGTILDPFAGSGSTGVAALKTGRRFLGCEIDPKYARIARRRLKEAEHTLFPSRPALLPGQGSLFPEEALP